MSSHILGLVGLSIVILWSLLAFQTGVEIDSFPHMLGGAMFFIPSSMVAILIIYDFVEQNVNQWRKKKQESLSLKTFFKWWLEQAEAEHPPMFITRTGLCYALEMWLSNRSTTPAQKEALTEELRQKLREYTRLNKLHYLYPFGGQQEFFHDIHQETAHKNPMRIAWVKEQLQKDLTHADQQDHFHSSHCNWTVVQCESFPELPAHQPYASCHRLGDRHDH